MSEPIVASQVPLPRATCSTWRRRWWKPALPIGLLLAVIAVAAVYLLSAPQYEAAALLEIAERPEYVAFEPKEVAAPKVYFRTQMELIRSQWVLGRTVGKIKQLPEISKQSDPIEWLKKRISVWSANDSNRFEIRYSSPDPNNAALVVNEVTQQYLTALAEEATKRDRMIVSALDEEMRQWQEKVRALRTKVHSATQAVSSSRELVRPDPNSPAKTPLSELQARLVAVQVERAMLSGRIKASEEELLATEQAEKASAAEKAAQNPAAAKAVVAPLSKEEIELRDRMVRRAIDDNAEVKQWYSLLVPKQMQLLPIETTAELGKQDPSYIKLQKEIAKADEKLAELKQKAAVPIQKDVEFFLRAKRGHSQVTVLARRREELAQMRTELRGHEIAEENLRKAYARQLERFLKEQLYQVSQEDVNLVFMKDELAQAQKVFKQITERQIALQTERAAPSRVILLNPAQAPQARVEAVPYKKMAMAGLVGLCLPYATALIALVLSRLGKPIRKLEPAETDVVTPPPSPS